jgi:HSP20 family protein
MAIQRWNPQGDLVRLQENVNRMFDEVLDRSEAPGADRVRPGDWKPALDLFDDGEQYVLRADLPGVTPGEVDIRVEEDRLELSGERRSDREIYLRMERPSGRFSARVALPPSVDRQRVRARHQNGVLEILLPKRQREGTPSRVEIVGA